MNSLLEIPYQGVLTESPNLNSDGIVPIFTRGYYIPTVVCPISIIESKEFLRIVLSG
jgi:hypothetical protein